MLAGENRAGPRLELGRPTKKGPGAVRKLSLKIRADKLDERSAAACCESAFDGSQRPQVEAPLGDFFASGPGVNPFASLPFTVAADGTMTCRFVMPYREYGAVGNRQPHRRAGAISPAKFAVSPWKWDDDSMYFHAKWRIDPDLYVGRGAIDLPYAVVIGKGVFVGCAAMIMNPERRADGRRQLVGRRRRKVPRRRREGALDLRNRLRGLLQLLLEPARPFADPYCGQPLDSGPDTPATSRTTASRSSTPCHSRNRWRPFSNFGRTRHAGH